MKKTLFGAFILFWFSTFEAFWKKKKKVLKEMIFLWVQQQQILFGAEWIEDNRRRASGKLEGNSKVKHGYSVFVDVQVFLLPSGSMVLTPQEPAVSGCSIQPAARRLG